MPSTVLGTAGNGKITETRSGLLSSSSSDHRRDRLVQKTQPPHSAGHRLEVGRRGARGVQWIHQHNCSFLKEILLLLQTLLTKVIFLALLARQVQISEGLSYVSRWDFLEGANSFLPSAMWGALGFYIHLILTPAWGLSGGKGRIVQGTADQALYGSTAWIPILVLLLVTWPPVSFLSSLCLRFFLHKMGITVHTS